MKYLITSALPYINGVKHLGNLIGSLLPADVYARFLRQQGHEVLYICGTDEHGTPAEIAAQNEGIAIKDYCDKLHRIQKDIYAGFNIDFDYFGRSSSTTNKKITQEIFAALDKNGLIFEKQIEQFYSLDDKRFLPDRYVIGTCPHCQYDKARGDQCDQCGRLLNPVDLINPKSAINSASVIEKRQENHLFLALDKMTEPLEQWLAQKQSHWPTLSVSIAKKWLNEGLRARCISRDLDWGVPILKPGYERKVFYVWFDAPMSYISMTQDWAKEINGDKEAWRRWWLDDLENTCYVQFMAKDNVPFHSIMWPAMLLGTGVNWKTVDILKGFNWLTYAGGKFSTSLQRGIFSDVALTLFSADYWRYYLLANIPETDDSDFRIEDFIAVINKDLVGTLGNFINRVATLLKKYFDNTVPEYQPENQHIATVQPMSQELVTAIIQDFYALNFRSAMRKIRELWSFGNEFISQTQPWKRVTEDHQDAANILAVCLHFARIFAIVSYPIMPDCAEKIFGFLQLDIKQLKQLATEHIVDFSCLTPKKLLSDNLGLLFEKISADHKAALIERFS